MSRDLSPSSQAVALHFAAMLHQLGRDNARVQACAEESRAIALEHGFSFWFAGANVLSGWALADAGRTTEGGQTLRDGLREWLATDSVTYQTYYLGLLAEVLIREGQAEEGLRIIAEALDLVKKTGEKLYEPELHRLQGELLLLGPAEETHSRARQCFEQALALAREQEALALEIRAAISLGKLAHRQGRAGEVRPRLESVCHLVTEGFQTPDYLEATRLLEQMN